LPGSMTICRSTDARVGDQQSTRSHVNGSCSATVVMTDRRVRLIAIDSIARPRLGPCGVGPSFLHPLGPLSGGAHPLLAQR
jgi:hypothetical protein